MSQLYLPVVPTLERSETRVTIPCAPNWRSSFRHPLQKFVVCLAYGYRVTVNQQFGGFRGWRFQLCWLFVVLMIIVSLLNIIGAGYFLKGRIRVSWLIKRGTVVKLTDQTHIYTAVDESNAEWIQVDESRIRLNIAQMIPYVNGNVNGTTMNSKSKRTASIIWISGWGT